MVQYGIPYGRHDETGAVICPACGVHIREETDATGEALTTRYAEHYERSHGPNAPVYRWQVGLKPSETATVRMTLDEASWLAEQPGLLRVKLWVVAG